MTRQTKEDLRSLAVVGVGLGLLDFGIYLVSFLGHIGSSRHAEHALLAAGGVETIVLGIIGLVLGVLAFIGVDLS